MSVTIDFAIIGPALLAGLLVIATHVPLGQRVLERGIIFIDLALAQIAGLGVIAAHSVGWEPGGWQVQLAAGGAALAGALALYLAERRWSALQEAIIGSAFVLAASASILLLAANPQGGEHLKELLAGQILWVHIDQLLPTAALYALVLLAWFGAGSKNSGLRFYVLFALTVTASVQLVGVYLVFASLILPALATRGLSDRSRLYWGYSVGVLGYAAGIVLSALIDLPTGPAIVWMLAVAALCIGLVPTRSTARRR